MRYIRRGYVWKSIWRNKELKYFEFQEHIRNHLDEEAYATPMQWEQKAWIEIAEYRKKQEVKRSNNAGKR